MVFDLNFYCVTVKTLYSWKAGGGTCERVTSLRMSAWEAKHSLKGTKRANFCNICPCTKDIEQPRFEDFMFLYAFMNIIKVSCAKSYG